MTEVDSAIPEGSNSSSPAAPAAASSSSAAATATASTISSTTATATSSPASSVVKADEIAESKAKAVAQKAASEEEQTATTTPAAAAAPTATATIAKTTDTLTETTTSSATKTATSITKDNGVALADAPSVAIGGGGGGGGGGSSMAPSDSVQACKERRQDAANDVVKPMDVDDADEMRDGAMDVDGEGDDSQITSSTENGGGGARGAEGNGDGQCDDDDDAGGISKSKSDSPPPAKRAQTNVAASVVDGSKTDGVAKAQNAAAHTPQSDANSDTNSNSCDEAPTSAGNTTHNANSKHANSSAIGSDNKSNNSNNVTTAASQKAPVEKSSAAAVAASTLADDGAVAAAKTRAQSEEGEDRGAASHDAKQVANNTASSRVVLATDKDAEKSPRTSSGDKQPPTKSERTDEQKSNGSIHVGDQSAKAQPVDMSVSEAPIALTGKKENGIAGDIERAKEDIVSLDDDSDEEESVERDPLALTKSRSTVAPNGDVAAGAAGKASASSPKEGVNMSMPKKSLSSDSDGAVIIGSDSENEAATVQSRPTPLPLPLPPPLAVVQPKDLAKSKPETQVIDDDDDDCVVIEDDTPAPMASDLSKRKSGAFDVTNSVDESQPPHKRQRNNNGTAIPTPMNNSMNQITIKDARSLMPQEIGTKRGADGNIYPVTITPAQSLMQQGPPKLVPMTNPGTMPLPVLPGLTCNANLLPGLTDDMFVLEAPSFIVPYIYEKPPPDNLKDVIKDIQTKHQLSKEDLAEADKSDEFDMITEQNKEDRDEKDSTASSSNNKNKRKRRRGDDESWSEESDEDEDDDDDDSESGMRTKVLIKEASDDLTAIKGAIKPAAAVAQSAPPAPGMPSRPGQENYFESPLGKFFMDIGVGLVQEFVQSDLIRLQKRKMRKSIGKNITEFERAITALSGNLEASKKKNSPFKFTMKRCEFCNFKSESALAMANHYETPHMHGIQYKCNFCTFEIRNATEIVYHMEAIHNIKARLIKPLPYHQCPNCGFEDNGKAKLARHHPVCAKKFRPELNLAPPTDWEAPAKIPRIKPRHGLVGTATAYQAMAAQAAAQKAALASIQQQQQAAQARSLQAAALAAQTAANKIRGRPPMIQKPAPGPSPPSLLRGPSTVRNPMPTNVVLPNNFQMAANQLLPHAANAMSKKNMPSVSITPLPRQSTVPPAATPSTSKLPPAGMKPGQSPNSTGKTQFVICEICDYYIKDLEQLRNHMQSMHKVKIHPKMIYNRPPLNCQKCQFRFFTDQGLERHLLGSHGLVTSSMQEAANKSKDGGRCPVCGKTYLCKLLNHVSRDHHMTLKPAHLSYKCTVCTATFGMYKQFETHVYTAHSTVAKKAMDAKKSNTAPNPAASSSNNQRNNIGMYNESLLKPLKINDEITIIPQPASKPRITNMESHVID